MNIEDHILALVAKKLASEASEEELRELDELLHQHRDIEYRVKQMAEWWLSNDEQSAETNGYSCFQKILDQIRK
jgi:hypothetical protein